MSKLWQELLRSGLVGMGIAGMFAYMEELRRTIPTEPATPIDQKAKNLVDAWDSYWQQVMNDAQRKEMLREAADIVRRQQAFDKKWKLLP